MNETTFTGREVDPFNLRPCDIELETIAAKVDFLDRHRSLVAMLSPDRAGADK